jgi:chromosome segregation ATPase
MEPFLQSQAYCTAGHATSFSTSFSSGLDFTRQPGRVANLERELEEAWAELVALRLARVSEREESAARVESM